MKRERLLKNIVDQVKELQIKLGYAKETVRLYYPVESLTNILGVERSWEQAEDPKMGFRQFLDDLNGNLAFTESALGCLRFGGNGRRMWVSIPPEGSEYIHQHVVASEFLLELIELFQQNHHLELHEVETVFAKYAGEAGYLSQQMEPGTDFDHVFHLMDSQVDEYYYCIKLEMGHTIYHRFLEEDYRALL